MIKANFFCELKTRFLINKVHKIDAAIDKFEESFDIVVLPFLLF